MIKAIFKIGGIVVIGLIVLLIVGGLIFVSQNNSGQKDSSGLGLFSLSPTEPAGFSFESPVSSTGLNSRSDDFGQAASGESSRLVVRTGAINMVVKDISGSVANIIQYTEDKNGWVVSSWVAEEEEIPSGSITVRVPAEFFDQAMAYFKGLAEKISYEGTQGQDVTEEYTDLQSRLRNLEAAEIQLLKIMERSGNIPDVLAVQREITAIRSQIEQTKGRMQYLETSAEMATISINLALSEGLLPIPSTEKWRPIYVLKQAWRSVLVSLKGISYFLIWFGIYAVVWIPLVIIVWQIRKFWKRRKENRGLST